jgi:hypothetical protein
MVRSSRIACLVVLLLLPAVGCSDKNSNSNITAPKDNAGFLLVNGTGLSMSVTVAGPHFTTFSETVAAGGFNTVEVYLVAGDVVTVTASSSEWTAGSGGCAVPQSLIDGYPDTYAQVTLADPGVSGQPVNVICSSGWE